MWTCRKCSARNWEGTAFCSHCRADRSGQLEPKNRITQKQPSDPFYSITLSPGDVRFISVADFLAVSVEDWIDVLSQFNTNLKVDGPWTNGALVFNVGLELDTSDNWSDKLRVQHAFGNISRDFGIPQDVYRSFHSLLRLKALEFAECANAWVKDAWKNLVVTQSFTASDQHLLANDSVVFKKTPFIIQRLQEIQKDADASKTLEDLERLRRSRFTTFVYLMEDLTNGYYKIGRSQTPQRRERTLQSEAPRVVLRFSIPADNEDEKKLHKRFSQKRIRGEWFALTSNDVASVVAFLKGTGDTERAELDYGWFGKISFGAEFQSCTRGASAET